MPAILNVTSGSAVLLGSIFARDTQRSIPRNAAIIALLPYTLAEKASALGFSLVANHGFVDGNKRVGYSAMETFLLLNGYEFSASTDEGERVILAVAAGEMEREEFTGWVRAHIVPRTA